VKTIDTFSHDKSLTPYRHKMEWSLNMIIH